MTWSTPGFILLYSWDRGGRLIRGTWTRWTCFARVGCICRFIIIGSQGSHRSLGVSIYPNVCHHAKEHVRGRSMGVTHSSSFCPVHQPRKSLTRILPSTHTILYSRQYIRTTCQPSSNISHPARGNRGLTGKPYIRLRKLAIQSAYA
jgi:hypothetical protein